MPQRFAVASVWGVTQTGLRMNLDFVDAENRHEAVGLVFEQRFDGSPCVMITAAVDQPDQPKED